MSASATARPVWIRSLNCREGQPRRSFTVNDGRIAAARHCSLTRCAYENEIPKLAHGDRRRNAGLRPRFCDTETRLRATHAPVFARISLQTAKSCKNKDWLAGAPGFE